MGYLTNDVFYLLRMLKKLLTLFVDTRGHPRYGSTRAGSKCQKIKARNVNCFSLQQTEMLYCKQPVVLKKTNQ